MTMLTLLLALALAAPSFTTAGQQPQLAAHEGRVFLAVADKNRVAVARSGDAGRTFAPVTPITPRGVMAAGMHRGPRVAVTRAAVLVAVVAGPQGAGKDGDVVLYRSTDEGGSWGSPVIVNDVPAAAREGLHGLAASPDGVVVLTWLDLRQKGTRVMAAVSRDHGATWSGDVLVYASPDGAVCECCHPSAAVAPDGTVAVMFRNQLQGARDLYVAGSRDGLAFANAAKQGVGTWVLNACPMDGGGLAATPGGLVSAWRREDGIFLSTPAAPEQRLGTGRDPAVAASPAGTDIAWTGAEGVVLRRGASSVVLGKGRFPALLAFPSHTLVAYEQQGRVVTAVVPR